MNVYKTENGTYEVSDENGKVLASGFNTEAQAWSWVDRYNLTEEGRYE